MKCKQLAAALLGAAALVSAASAAEVTIALVTPSEAKTVSIEQRQALWMSPFEGWAVTAWPFGLSVDETPILGYRSALQVLMSEAAGRGKAPAAAALDGPTGTLAGGKETVRPDGLTTFRLDRRASVRLDLAEGRHTLHPFGIAFTVAGDGTVASADRRLRIDAKARRVEVICYPVTVKMIAGGRSVSGPVQFACASTSLLGGLDNVFDEYDKQRGAKPGTATGEGLRRLTLYLPASTAQVAYVVNGVRFDLDAEGRVRLAAGAKAACPDGREIRLQLPAEARDEPRATRLLGVSWFGAPGEVTITCGPASIVGSGATGSGSLRIPATGDRTAKLGELAVRLPVAEPHWPYALLVWDVAGGACWAVEAAPLAAKPGAEWSCRITPLAGEAPVPAALKVRLDAVVGGAAAGQMALKAADGGVFAGALPAEPGLWQLRVADGSGGPLGGQTLGLVLIAGEEAVPAVSLFTVRNLGIVRRGDNVDVLWSAWLPAGRPAAEWPVTVRGGGFEAQVGRITLPDSVAARAASGLLKLDTSALAPGAYELAVRRSEVACYPMRLHVCQREPLSDYEVYSFYPVVRPHQPYPGSPVTLYRNHMPGGPGLEPFRADADASLDAALAAYAGAPAGPAREMFDRPTSEELDLMALAAMGMRAAPPYPTVLPAEDQNPKHTLSDDLAQMGRRMALCVQPRADLPGFDGISIGWFATRRGFWEYTPRLDGHQKRRNEESDKWVKTRLEEAMAKYKDAGLTEAQRESLWRWMNWRAYSSILPAAFGHWFADALQIRPDLTLHNAKPTFWLGGWESFPPTAYANLTHRDAIDYTDYCIPPWGNFRAPAFLAMGNPKGQKTCCAYFTHNWRSEHVATAFGAAGRGLDGFALSFDEDNRQAEAVLRIFERFGSWFTALDPLPDVAVYFNDNPNRASVILHDLARMRRAGMLVSPEDVLAGALSRYKVLFLAGLDSFELPEIAEAVRAFDARGGVIIKDDACNTDLPGRKLGFAYDKTHVHSGWGLGSPKGEWEFAHLWKNFKETREKFLIDAFAQAPGIPVTTPDAGVILSPLAGRDSIVCFVLNKTEVPLEIEGRWRQAHVLPRIGELRVEKGWHVHDLLAGKAAPVESTPQGQRVAVDFTRLEGAIFLLTRREAKAMAIRTERTRPDNLRLTAWLADAGGKPLADPMPFEVTLKGPDGATVFHKFAALGPELALDVPVPALSGEARLELVVRDLVLGSTAARLVLPAAAATVRARAMRDLIGGAEPIAAFLSRRTGPVTAVLGEQQDAFRPAAEQLAALLRKSGREACVVTWDLADIRPLHLRWHLLKEDLDVMESLKGGRAFAWRVGLSPWVVEKHGFDDPRCGYDEYGPRMRCDADIVLFGTPSEHRALADLKPYLRRTVTDSYPAAGGFFVHYLWSPFRGGCDGLYVGCQDAAGAEAAVTCLAELPGPTPAPVPNARPHAEPVVTRGGAAAPLENMVDGKFGAPVLDVAFSPDGSRVFVTTASYGDWLFVLSPSGQILDRRMPPVRDEFPNWWNWARGELRPVDNTSLWIRLWDADYHYRFDREWVGTAAADPPHELPRPGNGGGPAVKASTRLDSGRTGVTYLGGSDRLCALDRQGRLLWRFEDSAVAPDLLYPRGMFPRAVSGDGRVLLVAAFGVHRMLYATAARNPSVMGIDAATGKLLWQRKGMVLDEGKVVALHDRFLVIDDEGKTHEILAADGRKGFAIAALSGSADWVLQLPGRDAVLIVENSHFDRQGRTARVYIRQLDGGGQRDLAVPGRVLAVELAPDNQSFLLCTMHDRTTRFGSDGSLLWDSETPAAQHACFSPDGRTVVVGGHDGVVRFLSAADGKRLHSVDLNSFNVISPERFVRQERMGAVPQDAAWTVPPEPPEPSYLTSLDPKKVPFGPNLAPPERMRRLLKPAEPAACGPAKPGYVGKLIGPVTLTFKVEAGTTYLVEMLNAVAEPADHTPLLRLEVAVTAAGGGKTKNLPYTARLPLATHLKRRRAAFRADAAGEVTLTLRTVLPHTVGEGRKASTTYENAPTSEIPVLLGDIVVSAIRFRGRNLLFNGGPMARSTPAGELTCTMFPWNDGDSSTSDSPVDSPAAALRLTNGVIANQETAWAKAGRADKAEVLVRFRTPRKLSAVAAYEDASGPVPDGDRVRERTAMRYGLDVRNAVTGQWSHLGHVVRNTQLINIFEGPAFAVDEIRYTWAGRHDEDQGRTDGAVRTAQIEAYMAADALDIEDLLNRPSDDGLGLE
ncbi:MAG TPA: PQQ-binding-like beta-propeller repeat protein [Phycisphaerae bacterium]|nr:PQQ-binding-like beta-propeller repeat protein [Phycisphaerae bacterium]